MVGRVERNWAGNHAYGARVAAPARHASRSCASWPPRAPRIRVLGTRHSFTAIADSEELCCSTRCPAEVAVDRARGVVLRLGRRSATARWRPSWRRERVALANLASLPHISVAGAVATATHGSGDRNGNLATAVAGLELVTSAGELVTVRRGDPDFEGHVVALGALGAVVRLELDVEPAYEVRQHVFEGLAWDALLGTRRRLRARVLRRGVHALGRGSRPGLAQAPRRRPARRAAGRPRRRRGPPPDPRQRPAHATPQLGEPGPWSQRLPHFRLEFTPSNGAEIQSEYHVAAPPRRRRDRGAARRGAGVPRRWCWSPSCARSPPTSCG